MSVPAKILNCFANTSAVELPTPIPLSHRQCIIADNPLRLLFGNTAPRCTATLHHTLQIALQKCSATHVPHATKSAPRPTVHGSQAVPNTQKYLL
jgi:hypothetical protein